MSYAEFSEPEVYWGYEILVLGIAQTFIGFFMMPHVIVDLNLDDFWIAISLAFPWMANGAMLAAFISFRLKQTRALITLALSALFCTSIFMTTQHALVGPSFDVASVDINIGAVLLFCSSILLCISALVIFIKHLGLVNSE